MPAAPTCRNAWRRWACVAMPGDEAHRRGRAARWRPAVAAGGGAGRGRRRHRRRGGGRRCDSGEKIYQATCFACHATGVLGAPKFGDKADWGPRIAQGTDTLVQHAINGFQGQKGIMPPKGGRADYSDADVAAAVQYMVSKAQ